MTDSTGGITSHTVTDLGSLKVYNDWLVGELQAGHIQSTNYDSLLTLGYHNNAVPVYVKPTGSDAPLDANSPLLLPVGAHSLLEATGLGSIARVTSGSAAPLIIAQGRQL